MKEKQTTIEIVKICHFSNCLRLAINSVSKHNDTTGRSQKARGTPADLPAVLQHFCWPPWSTCGFSAHKKGNHHSTTNRSI